jgi:hypothetical protein
MRGAFMPQKQQKTGLSLVLLTFSTTCPFAVFAATPIAGNTNANVTTAKTATTAATPPANAATETAKTGFTRDIENALKFGKGGAIKIDARYFYENVNQDNVPNVKPALQPKTANANTLRLRLGVLSPKYYNFQGYVEYEGLYSMIHDYNSTRNGKSQYSVIPDPTANRVNQLWLNYEAPFKTNIKGGRQEMAFDDQRFIGKILWRQLGQVLDSVLITNTSVKNLTVSIGYIGRVATITNTTENTNAPIANIKYSIGNYGDAVAYGYWLGYTQADTTYASQNSKSNQSYGLRFVNSEKPIKIFNNKVGLLYLTEWSLQKDFINSPVNYQVNRWYVMGGFTVLNLTFQGAMEQKDGHGVNQTFTNPLGTNHAFQGWAEVFLINPAHGIRDVYGAVSTKFESAGVLLQGVFHDFSDDTGNISYGDEWDFQATKKFGKHYSLMATYANFNSSGYNFGPTATNTQKIWLQGNINF